MIDDIDAITPCPIGPDIPSQPIEELRPTSSNSNGSSSSRSSISSSRSSFFRLSHHHIDDDSVSLNLNRRRASAKAVEEGTNGDPDRLWMRMLALQQKYGCYNSARMSAALSSGNTNLLRPSKACLDMLNEHMTALPESVISWLRPN